MYVKILWMSTICFSPVQKNVTFFSVRKQNDDNFSESSRYNHCQFQVVHILTFCVGQGSTSRKCYWIEKRRNTSWHSHCPHVYFMSNQVSFSMPIQVERFNNRRCYFVTLCPVKFSCCNAMISISYLCP